MELYKEVKKVREKDQFTEFISLLVKDFKSNPDEWEKDNAQLKKVPSCMGTLRIRISASYNWIS
ncbi:hypothetical protein [Paenibacillus shenyangensis]|uniref:hypothetical protein n=1 Tax=Paenibacillus sp. A9 TaxID=1284352 RepID=UPI000366B5BC|nr:hypothetical protein [Paenibacillus sp. A9]